MLKKSFLGLTNFRIEYELLPVKVPEPEKVSASKRLPFFTQKTVIYPLHQHFKPATGSKPDKKLPCSQMTRPMSSPASPEIYPPFHPIPVISVSSSTPLASILMKMRK